MLFRQARSLFASRILHGHRGGKSRRRDASRWKARRQLLEQLETRDLMALNIISVSPADDSTNVPVDTNLVFTFNEPVIKGQGSIHLVRQSTDTHGIEVDVNSSAVTISGATVTVDLPSDLQLDNSYYVLIDDGSFIDTSSTSTPNATLLTENFDLLALQPFTTQSGGDGTDFTKDPPVGWVRDNTNMSSGGVDEWQGWSFADKISWSNSAGDQSRSAFTKGTGSVALGDPDQFDDAANGGPFNGALLTRAIKLTGVAANTAVLEFDSSFRPEDSQVGKLDVRFDGGAWVNLLTLDPSNTSNDAPTATFNNVSINEHLTSGVNTGVSSDGKGNAPFSAVLNPAGATTAEFRFSVVGQNDWWWAIDNVKVKGTLTGVPFTGVSSKTFWNFSAPESPKLTLTIDKTEMSENGGTAIGTITRNGLPNGAVTVNLESNDTTEATVPASVTIPDGQLFATFPITAVDDTLSDRTQPVLITATDAGAFYSASSKSINVLDDEGPKIVSLTPADNATGVDYKSNLIVTFDGPVRKGNGLIKVIRSNDNVMASSVDVNSTNVTVAGATVTIDIPINLPGLTDYYVLMDDGVFYDLSATPTPNAVLFTQDFEYLPLKPFVTEPLGDGTDFTNTPPLNMTVDNSGMPNSTSDLQGWTFLDKNSWVQTAGGQGREQFVLGTGNVAVADPDEWDDVPHDFGGFNSFMVTSLVSLTGLAAGSVVLEFDSSFRPELPQIGTVQASYDGGGSWTEIMAFDNNDVRSAHIVIDSTATVGQVIGGGTIRNQLINPTSGDMLFRFGMLNGGNNWWWAVDNITIRGGAVGLPFQGITSPSTWNFTTAEAPTLTVTIDKTSMSENGGTALGTVTRNLSSGASPALTVTLTSSDTTELTVPASVVIPAGAASVTFPITAVDDLISDGTQLVTITATATDFFNVPATISVLDDDFPKVNTFSPADNATAVPVNSNLVITFDQPVKKGNGFIYVLRSSDGKLGTAVDVQSSAVTISGATVTINPPADLAGLTDYYVSVQPGAILSTLSTIKDDAVLLQEDFESLPLGPAVFETVGVNANGKDFTTAPPSGYSVDNSAMPPGGVPEWTGWTFADKSFWQTQGGQNRANFTRGSGTIAIGDTDEWDDTATLNNNFNSLFLTSPINLDGVQSNTVNIEFDSSFRPEDSQVGKLDVSFDGGTNWTNLLTLDPSNTSNATNAANINERRVVPVSNPSTGSMRFRFGVTGANDWWWALDNIKVTGDANGLPYPGIVDTTTWNFTTAEAAAFTVTTAAPTIGENGGTTTLTVTRNLSTANDVTVNLASSNTTIATVPASVVIPAGQASATFTLTAIDDAFADGRKNVMISASSTDFVSGSVSVGVLDDEVVDVIVTELMYNPVTSEPRGEWIELYNRGSVTADLSGWKFDDEDNTNWGVIPAGTQLAPGKVAVIYNSIFETTSEATFRTEWAVPADALVVGTRWGNLENSPAAGGINENLNLVDAASVSLDLVNYDDDGTVWPGPADGPSIYLTNLIADNNVGTNWARSVVGTLGGRNPLGGTGAIYNVGDIGSPGMVPSANSNPLVGSDSAAVSGAEGTTITNTGTWSDPDAGNVVTLSASAGTVVKNANGTWSWSISTTDNQAATSVIITADDGQGGTATTSFTYTVDNANPVVAANNASVSGNVLSTITNTGTWSDVAADTVTLSASIGTVVKNADGTWSWSITPSALANNQVVTITATDEDGGNASTTFTLTALVAVTNRKLFYNNSGFETVGGVAAALDTNKVLLQSGSTSQITTFANVSNYSRGINGVVLDVAGLASTALTAADFTLRVAPAGASGVVTPSTWASAPAPSAIVVTPGTASAPARIQLEWADNQIQNTWLQIIVRANANTGLNTPAVFYLGHATAEINGASPYRVTGADLSLLQAGISNSLVPVTDARDVNKDRRITGADLSFVQQRISNTVILNNITIPAAGSTGEGSGAALPPQPTSMAPIIESKPQDNELYFQVGFDQEVGTGSKLIGQLTTGGQSINESVVEKLAMDSIATKSQAQSSQVESLAADEFFKDWGRGLL